MKKRSGRSKFNSVLRLSAALFAVLAVLLSITEGVNGTLPVKADTSLWPVGPDIAVKGAMVIEADTGTILYKKDAYTAYQPANLTQLMTTLLVMENCSLMDVMTMSTKAETATKGSRVGLVRKEQVTVESALYAVLLASGNEVAYGLSEHVSGDRDKFVDLMNRRAGELGLSNSHFSNPEGSDDDKNYTCASDLAIIAREAYKNPEFLKITSSARYTIPQSNLKEARPITNRHLMIKGDVKYEQAVAGKVAYSAPSGYSAVTYCRKDGMNIICVVLGAATRDGMYNETKKICNWCFENYKAYDIREYELASSSAFASLFDKAPRFGAQDSDTIVRFEGSNVAVVPKGVPFSEITRRVTFNDMKEYYHGENRVGTVNYEYGGIFVGSADIIYYNEGYPLNNEVLDRMWPPYLFKIDTVFSPEHAEYLKDHIEPVQEPTQAVLPTDEPKPTLTEQQENTEKISAFRRKIIIASGIGAALVLIGLYFVIFELPRMNNKLDIE
jgi:D-alanyl-D-alanine carboxypeptidase